MALILADRVKETCAAPGTGTVSLLGASTGFQAFSSAIGDGNTCYYTISDQGGANWEVGIGTYASSGNTLARTTVLSSSAGGTTKANFSTGTQDVFVTYPAEVAAYSSNSPSTSGYVLTANGAGIAPSWQANANGDVVGPASATDNAVARFDGTTGKLIQNSAVTIGDDGATVIAANSMSNGLRITQIGSGNALVVEDSANPDSTPFVVDASGNVVKGYTSPVTTGGFTPTIQAVGQASTSTMSLGAIGYSATSTRVPSLFFGKSASDTIGAESILSSGNTVGQISFAGSDGTAQVTLANIQAAVDGTPGTNDMPGRLVFSTTADGASSPTERMRITREGNVGIGVIPNADVSLNIGKAITGSVSHYGVASSGTVQSDVTAEANIFLANPKTQATSFTLAKLNHFTANQGTFGAGSTVTNQHGFRVEANLTGATNNYGFHSNIAAGTGRYNFYAAGTAANYFAGNTYFAGPPVIIGNTQTSIAVDGITAGLQIHSGSSTNGASVSVLRYANDQYAGNISIAKSRGSASTRTIVNSGDFLGSLTFNGDNGTDLTAEGAVIYCAVDGTPSATSMPGRLVFQTTASGAVVPTERMRIDSAGNVGIGGAAGAGVKLDIKGSITGSTTSYAALIEPTFGSDVTNQAYGLRTSLTLPSAGTSLSNLSHFSARTASLGTTTLTSQFGFNAESTLTGATNNYGFYSGIASGTGRYNFYAGGSADNYFAGNVGIGVSPTSQLDVQASGQCIVTSKSTSSYASFLRDAASGQNCYDFYRNNGTEVGRITVGSTGIIQFANTSAATERMRIDQNGRVGIGAVAGTQTLLVGKALTGGTDQRAIEASFTVNSDVTAQALGCVVIPNTQAAAFTLNTLYYYSAYQGTFGAGSSVTNQYGFFSSGNITGATNNYGFYSAIASGAGRYNFYAAGSADNYFAGNLFISSATSVADSSGAARVLQVKGTTGATAAAFFGRYSNDSNPSAIILAKSRGAGVGTNTVVQAEDIFGRLSFDGADGTNLINAAFIQAVVDGTPGTNDMPGRLVFATTADGTSSPTERMRIDNQGNVIHTAPTTAPTLSTNGTMVFNLTSNTNLRVSVRGSDGVTRTANITLA